MSKYIIARQTTDGLGVDQLSVVEVFNTRADAVKGARELAPGTYSLLSELRGSFTVRPSERVIQTVVDWGKTSQPRPRKAKANGGTSPKKSASGKKSKMLTEALNEVVQ